ncbi:hypothetical protein CGCFRS4_v009669 [Colletotrichum fructicola]|nr:hypothetical protein CGCFRS4_v009669 [Colletotrichum fructicola]
MFGGARPESTSGARAFCILSSISSAQARVRKFNDQHGKKTSCIKQILPVALDPFAGVWILDSVKAPSRKSRICDDCILEPMQLEVNSPISHTESRADEFKSASSCVASGYAYTSPPPYIPSPTSSSESLAVVPQDCLNATTGYICVGPPAINIKPSNASVDMTNRTSHYIRVSLP